MNIIKKLKEVDNELSNNGYKDWCYARLTITEAINKLSMIKVKFTDGTSILRLPPCDPPNTDIQELLKEEYGFKYYGFEWVNDIGED
jgi:hypothetical protein